MGDGTILAVMLQDLIEKKGYPSWTNVTCLREGTETPLFKQNFANWVDKNETTSLVKPVRSRQTGTSYKQTMDGSLISSCFSALSCSQV